MNPDGIMLSNGPGDSKYSYDCAGSTLRAALLHRGLSGSNIALLGETSHE